LLRAWSFVTIPALIGPFLGPLAGGFIVDYLHWRIIFFVNLPMGLLGLYMTFRHMPDYRAAKSDPLDFVGLILFSSGIALLSYVLEIFGEHSLSLTSELCLLVLSVLLLVGLRSAWAQGEVSAAASASFRHPHVSRRGGGKFHHPPGRRWIAVLIAAAVPDRIGVHGRAIGAADHAADAGGDRIQAVHSQAPQRAGIPESAALQHDGDRSDDLLFMTIGPGTPVWVIAAEAFCFGLFSSIQFLCMNTLAFADLEDADESNGSSIASTVQQMSMSFGVAIASLATIVLLGGNRHPTPARMVWGIHRTFLALGLFTMATAWVFRELRPDDGASVSRLH
jgi:hypothetical protein